MAAQIFGSAATVLEMNIAVLGTVPSNNVFNNQLASVGTNNANLVSYVNLIANTNFAGVPDSQVATTVLNNVLGADPANNATLNAALTALLAANPANRGVVIYNVVNILTTLENNTTYGAAAKIFNQEVTNGNVYSSDPTSNVAAPPNPNIPVVVGKSFTLTTGVDVLPGTAADDVFFGTEATLSSLDTLTGGGGNDTLKFASSGAGLVNKAGFTTTGIQTAQVTSDATGGTNFDVTGMTGVTTLVNDNSSTDVIFNGAANVMAATLQNVSGGNTQFVYQAAAVAGTSDAMNITLSNNKQINGTTIGTVTANGIEAFNVTTSKGASVIQELASAGSLKSITIAGDSSLTLGAANFFNTAAANTVDASKLTGNLNLTLSNDDAANIAVAVTGGSGNDRVSFKAFDKGDSFTGGAGTDTIALTNAVATGSPAGTLSGVETLEDTDASIGTINMSNFAGVTNVFLSKGLAGNTVVSNATTGITETVNVGTAAAADLTTSLKTDGTADAITLQLNNVDKASTLGNVVTTGFETVNLNAAVVSGLNGTGALSIANLNDTSATTLNVNSGVNLTLTAANTGALTKVDASASTGNLTLDKLTYSTAGATILGGKGNDTFTPGNGADTITLGAGADVLTYTATTQSNDKMDIVTDFTSGTDKLNLTALGLIASSQFLGARTSFGLAQGALSANSTISAVLDSSTNILWVDSNGDGTLDNRDFRIQLNGVTSLTSTDLNLAASGTPVTVTATNANVSKTLSTGATGTTSDLGDTINTKVAFLASGTVDGANGIDTLVMQDAGAVAITANYTNIESLTLNTTGSTANTVTFTAGGIFKNITGSDNADTVTTANMSTTGGTISLGAGNDALTLSADLTSSLTVDLGAGDDSFTTGVATLNGTIGGGAGTDTFTQTANMDVTPATLSGFEVFDNGGFTTKITTAQYAGITTQVKGAGMITFSDSGAVSDLAASTANSYTLGSGGQSFTGNAAVNYAITGGAGNDTFTLKAGFTAAGDAFDGGAGSADKFVLAYDTTAAVDLNGTAATLVNVEQFSSTVNQTGGAITLDVGLTTVDLSAQTTALALTAAGVTFTSLKLGASNDTVSLLTTDTAAATIDMGAGADTITKLVTGTGNVSMTFGSGNDTITDIGTHGTGVLTFKFGTPAAASTQSLTFAATTANVAVNDVFQFASGVNSIVAGKADGTLGVAGNVGQVFVDTATLAGGTIITFDADGNRTFSVGDVQVIVTGNVLAFNITGGNLVVSSST